MHSSTTIIDAGGLATVDLVELGARTGLLWRSGDVVLAGMGEPIRVELDIENGAETARSILTEHTDPTFEAFPGSGAVGFTTLPFSRLETGTMLVPPIILGCHSGQRFVTGNSPFADVEDLVASAFAPPFPHGPTNIELKLNRPADSWRDDVVASARDRIARTSLQKAVFARLLTLQANTDFPIGSIVRDLAARFSEAHLFCVDGFVGASPELLVSRAGRTVRAHPLAGTAARFADPIADANQIAGLLASSKDRVEHRITIDWLLGELLPFCSYVDAEPEPSVLSLANVHHLGTLVEGVLSEPAASVLDLVAAVHPTPAVGGDPQSEALELIRELEGFDRGRYAGPTGWVDSAGNGEFAVSVRTAQISGSTAEIAAGVGVVAQSDPEAELAETQAKFQAMLGTFLRHAH